MLLSWKMTMVLSLSVISVFLRFKYLSWVFLSTCFSSCLISFLTSKKSKPSLWVVFYIAIVWFDALCAFCWCPKVFPCKPIAPLEPLMSYLFRYSAFLLILVPCSIFWLRMFLFLSKASYKFSEAYSSFSSWEMFFVLWYETWLSSSSKLFKLLLIWKSSDD